jgi:(p)ppGpp synthase/HD superfamily hydrolase
MSERVKKAREMAVKAHGQQMYGTHPYVVHLDMVAELVRPFGEEAEVVAYLHDTLEDTALPHEEVGNAFGPLVRACVEAMTDSKGATRKERKNATYERLGAITAEEPVSLALLVKAADRLANVRSCVKDGNESLLAMYRGENEAFRAAVLRAGLNEAMVTEIDEIVRAK